MNDLRHDAPPARVPRTSRRPWVIALTMVALIGGFYLLREHWDHIGGQWVYLLLLVCPLMHMFHGHGGHGGHGGHADPTGQDRPADRPVAKE